MNPLKASELTEKELGVIAKLCPCVTCDHLRKGTIFGTDYACFKKKCAIKITKRRVCGHHEIRKQTTEEKK